MSTRPRPRQRWATTRKAYPPRRSEEEIAAAVADDPDAAPIRTAAELEAMFAREDARDIHGVARLRRRLGLAQVQFVNRYRIPLSTLRQWEHGTREPDSASKVLLAVIAEDPELVARVAARVGGKITAGGETR